MFSLNCLADNLGAKPTLVRVGRGIGSGKGKTCGRGVKGQKSRSGVSIKGFEGGQMPIFRRLPKRGFTNINKRYVQVINLSDLQKFVDIGRIVEGDSLSPVDLEDLGLIRDKELPVKLLGGGTLETKLSVSVDFVSNSAREVFEGLGGTIKIGLNN